MESSVQRKHTMRKKRALRVRSHLRGTQEKPRLCVHKTNCHLHVQIIDDLSGKTLVGISTNSKEFKKDGAGKKNKESARKLGDWVASKAKELQIENVIFDRGSSKYHGVLAEFADAAREGGLQF